MMIRMEEMALAGGMYSGRMGERWQASAVRACTPAPLAAVLMMRSAWCKADRCGLWAAPASGEPAPSGGGARFGGA